MSRDPDLAGINASLKTRLVWESRIRKGELQKTMVEGEAISRARRSVGGEGL